MAPSDSEDGVEKKAPPAISSSNESTELKEEPDHNKESYRPSPLYDAGGKSKKSTANNKDQETDPTKSSDNNPNSEQENDRIEGLKEISQTENDSPTVSNWPEWAKSRSWEYYPESQYARMAMHGTYGEYIVQIFARRIGGIDFEPRDETEFKIQLLNGLPEGLYIGPIKSMSKAMESEPDSRPISISESLDPKLIGLTVDPASTKTLLAHPEVQESLLAMVDGHPLCRVNNRNVILRTVGLSTDDFDDWVDKILFLATTLDNSVNRSWEELADKYTLRMRPPDRNGYPSLRGKVNGLNIKISINLASGLTTYLRVSLGPDFPHDLTLIGSQYPKPEGLVPLAEVDYGEVATAFAEYPKRAIPVLNAPEVKEVLTFLFKTIPKSDIQYGELRLRISGRLDTSLEGVLKESITIAQMLQKFTEPDKITA